ncbi:MAG: 6-bladed beta-propeller, partial [Candidatus Dadabacteria bacterium]|nr:6-bladed beta-propeller [Candidatus Dadabacteria bacterium]
DRVQVFGPDGAFLFKLGSAGAGDGQFNDPAGLTINRSGLLYVADSGNKRIQIFGKTGRFLRAIGTPGTGGGQLGEPMGVAVDDTYGMVYVADAGNKRIQKFRTDGSFLLALAVPDASAIVIGNTGLHNTAGQGDAYVVDSINGRVLNVDMVRNYLFSFGSGGGQFREIAGIGRDEAGNIYTTEVSASGVQKFHPDGKFISRTGSEASVDVTIDSSGNMYVLEHELARVAKYGPDGTFLSSFGGPGSGDGQLSIPEGVALDAAGNVYVADFGNARVQKFNADGSFAMKFTYTAGASRPFMPTGIKVDSSGNILVLDISNRRFLKFGPNGNFLKEIAPPGTGDGQVDSPQRLDIDELGNIYVTDNHIDYVQVFGPDDKFIYKFGGRQISRGEPGKFDFSDGVTVTRAGLVYVGDSGNSRVVVFTREVKPDRDGDGLHGALDLDTDGDGMPVEEEGTGERDTDGDGVSDNHDLDSDGDGICDVVEAGLADEDGDCRYDDSTDENGNGLADSLDPDAGGSPAILPDTDGDGIPDYLDGDSDGDGICDVSEVEGGIDENDDCIYDNEEDLDGDGLADALYIIGGEPLRFKDSDRDGIPDHLDAADGEVFETGPGCALAPAGSGGAGAASWIALLFLPVLILARRSVRIYR